MHGRISTCEFAMNYISGKNNALGTNNRDWDDFSELILLSRVDRASHYNEGKKKKVRPSGEGGRKCWLYSVPISWVRVTVTV